MRSGTAVVGGAAAPVGTPARAYDRPMAASTLRYAWTQEGFLLASEAGAFTGRVELVDGEVWPVAIGRWHGTAAAECVHLSRADGVRVTTESLATAGSLPDPDVWVRPADAQERGWLSPRISRWDPSDVLLVVEISDETVAEDLGIKARLYADRTVAVADLLGEDDA